MGNQCARTADNPPFQLTSLKHGPQNSLRDRKAIQALSSLQHNIIELLHERIEPLLNPAESIIEA